jgi:hypothetical protein
MCLPRISISKHHKDTRPSELLFAIHFSQEYKTQQETADAEEYRQKYGGIVEGCPEDIQI